MRSASRVAGGVLRRRVPTVSPVAAHCCCRFSSSAAAADSDGTGEGPGPSPVLYIAASQLAEVSGLNRYVKTAEAEERFLQRNPRLAQQLDRQVAPRFRTRVEAAIHALPAEALASVAEAQQLPPTARPADVAAALQQAVVAPSVAEQSEADSQDQVHRLTQASPALAAVAAELIVDTRLQRGEAREDSALDTTAAALGQVVHQRNAKLHSKLWFSHRGYEIVVRGKVDGISETGRIVETKNRSRALFGVVRTSNPSLNVIA